MNNLAINHDVTYMTTQELYDIMKSFNNDLKTSIKAMRDEVRDEMKDISKEIHEIKSDIDELKDFMKEVQVDKKWLKWVYGAVVSLVVFAVTTIMKIYF